MRLALRRLLRLRNKPIEQRVLLTAGRRGAVLATSLCCVVSGVAMLASPTISAASPSSVVEQATPPTGEPTLSGNLSHLFGPPASVPFVSSQSDASPDFDAVCTAHTEFFNKFGATEVNGQAETICTKPELQAVQICTQQYYSGEWHSSETCNREPEVGTIDTDSLKVEGARWLRCTSGRKFRMWTWFYTPDAEVNPVTENYLPDGGGEARC